MSRYRDPHFQVIEYYLELHLFCSEMVSWAYPLAENTWGLWSQLDNCIVLLYLHIIITFTSYYFGLFNRRLMLTAELSKSDSDDESQQRSEAHRWPRPTHAAWAVPPPTPVVCNISCVPRVRSLLPQPQLLSDVTLLLVRYSSQDVTQM